MRFTYRSGQRPLDGYTLKRGVGMGGFGEVYFAVSDGGKEVALKLLRGHSDIELRGVANCLNLKHPNLVHVYDLKSDDHGDTWLVMEYVLGESLSQVIGRHPGGLPMNLAREWFLNLARAVGYLHDHGVVHRDLKPANIFVENGTLKVGDYGLCKSLHSSQKQTRTVGTVHYMAPEISTGNYNKSIDIYACGIVLHEMLTGQLPFDGESDGEILMKHLTATPDLTKVPMAFRPVIARALDKNPIRRYASTAELARAVEAAMLPSANPAPIPISIPQPPPVPVVTPVEEKAPEPTPAAAPSLPVAPLVPPPPPLARPVTASVRDRLTDASGALVKAPLVAALALVPYAVISQNADWASLSQMFLLTAALSWAMVIGAGGSKYYTNDTWARRLKLAGLGALVGVLAFWLDGWAVPHAPSAGAPSGETFLFGAVQVPPDSLSAGLKYLLYFAGVMGAGRWWKATARDRKDRFTLLPPLAAAFWGTVLMFLWPWQSGSPVVGGIVPLVLATVAVQAASAWSPPPPPAPKRLRFRPA
ncbi:MAG TPA: serine/threonine-protein kinase [Fimbriiglobus sp.]|jgi:serine/threonine protein kinase|nr:serine/threonine-protein kinase [Fimbriiglobus sp.]